MWDQVKRRKGPQYKKRAGAVQEGGRGKRSSEGRKSDKWKPWGQGGVRRAKKR